jgi:NADH:ubiquinone oxidoreductase subunit F (NADH-binding)
MSAARLFSGPDLGAGAESFGDHCRRLGVAPMGNDGLIATIGRSGLLGRGGGAFPVGQKWRSVADRSGRSAVVLANGAEGEPLSWKDRLLMAVRPHLVLDGAFLAAGAVGAEQVVLYVGEEHRAAGAAMARALAERPARERTGARLVASPPRYVAGEESAAVHFLNSGVATPTTVPPRPFERGVNGQSTLVQNVESLAQVALIARYGDDWYRSAGAQGQGTLLLSVSGAVATPGVLEVEAGTTIGEAVAAAGGASEPPSAVLLGGYFGGWVRAEEAWGLPLDALRLRERGLALGTGVVSVLPRRACGVCETARVLGYLAAESAAQCGPCFFGLRALADACTRIAEGRSDLDDVARLQRWARQVNGRGACRHPDGAVGFLRSALVVFQSRFERHSHVIAEAA